MNPTGSVVPMECLIPSKTPLKIQKMGFSGFGGSGLSPPYDDDEIFLATPYVSPVDTLGAPPVDQAKVRVELPKTR